MDALAQQLANHKNVQFDLVTNEPNRYQTQDSNGVYQVKHYPNIQIHRTPQKSHSGGMLSQTLLFCRFALFTSLFLWRNRQRRYNLVYATSSRLFTALLGSICAFFMRVPLYLDIRDLFVDTISEVVGGVKGKLLFWVFKPLQWFAFSRAQHINIVSQGFEQYVRQRYKKAQISCFTNGIDPIFYDQQWPRTATSNQRLRIYYAGNVGAGQGLEKVIPPLARTFSKKIEFVVIGSGSTLPHLQKEILNLDNVRIVKPMPRKAMLKELQNADALFLSLNNYPSLDKVLPSKLFEYAAINKPILAGLVGYAKQFAVEHIENCYVFDFAKIQQGEKQLAKLLDKRQKAVPQRKKFMQQFNRSAIMEQMAKSIVQSINFYN